MTEERALILLVEDDARVLASVRRRLAFEGYRVETAKTGIEALRQFDECAPDLVILDVMLPGMSGLEVAERLRADHATPILMLTARGQVADRVAGLESGADDYLVKPFAIEELLARIRALLRRVRPTVEEGVLRFSDLALDVRSREVFRSGEPIPMSAREFDILACFMRHARHVLTRSQIYDAVWGMEHMGGSNIIDVNIKSLRDKLELGGRSRLIQTVRRVGYCLRDR